jgi:hypothetical protein
MDDRTSASSERPCSRRSYAAEATHSYAAVTCAS